MSPGTRVRARLLVALLGPGVLFAALPPAAAVEPEASLGEPFVVNQVVDRDQGAPEVARRPDGGFTAVWKADPLVGGVFGRIFGGDGRPAGPEFSVIEETVGHRRPEARDRLALASDLSGRFAVVWTEFGDDLQGHLFDPDGRPSGPGFEVASVGPDADRLLFPAAAFTPDGRLWVVWAEETVGGMRIRVRSFGLDGEAEEAPEEIGGTRHFLNPIVTLAAASDGSALAAWTEPSGQGFAIRGRLHHPGTGWGDPFTVAGQLAERPIFLDAAAGSPDGGFAVVWHEGESVFLQLLETSGGRRGVRRKVPRTLEPAGAPAVAQDGAGNVLVAWGHDSTIRGRCFGPDGSPVTGDLLISPDLRFPHSRPDVAGLPAGGFIVVWETGVGDGWGSAILGRLVAPPSPGVVSLTTARYVVREDERHAEISVARNQGTLGPVSVRYRVRGETAVAGEDFEPAAGELSWTDGEGGPKSFLVPVADDGRREGEEEAVVELSSAGGGAVLGRAEARLVLRDDDGLARPGAASRQLSAADVECDRARLVGLVERTAAMRRSFNLALTATGDPFGVVYHHDSEDGVDAILSFSANAEETPLLRNPARPQLPTVSLTRNGLATDLVNDVSEGGVIDRRWLQMLLDPTLDGDSGAGVLYIDNALQPDDFLRAGQSTDTKPGRGLLPLLEPCHGRLTAQDVHVLRVLARTLRAGTGPGRGLMRTILYRGEEPGHYVIEVFESRSILELDLFVTLDADGSLLEGTLRVRKRCPPLRRRGCSTIDDFVTVALTSPLGAAAAVDPRYRVVVGEDVPLERPEVTFDWRELLAGTTWRKPL